MHACKFGSIATLAFFALLASIATGAGELAAQERIFIEPRAVADTSLTPLSGAVLVGNTLYILGLGGRGTPRRKKPEPRWTP